MKSTETRILRTNALCLAGAAAAALALSSPAFAHDGGDGFGDQAQVKLSGSIPAMCEFTTPPIDASISPMTTGAMSDPALLGFTCNLTSGFVHLNVTSANGALKRDDGNETVAYAVAWDIQGNAQASGNAADWTAPGHGFDLSPGTSGVEEHGNFTVTITGATAAMPAGTYRDTLTYEISP